MTKVYIFLIFQIDNAYFLQICRKYMPEYILSNVQDFWK